MLEIDEDTVVELLIKEGLFDKWSLGKDRYGYTQCFLIKKRWFVVPMPNFTEIVAKAKEDCRPDLNSILFYVKCHVEDFCVRNRSILAD